MSSTATLASSTTLTATVPGICAAEADLITAAARRFLARTAATPPDPATAAITAHIHALFDPYTPASIGDYNCARPGDTHWCST